MSEVMLVKYDAACKALAAATSVDEVIDIHNKAAAIQAYRRQANNKELEVQAVQIRIRAVERLGELLGETEKAEGAKGIGKSSKTPIKSAVTSEDRTHRKTLKELGISKNLSARARKLAAIPKEEFEQRLAELARSVKEDGAKVTTNLLKVGVKKKEPAAKKPQVTINLTPEEFEKWNKEATWEDMKLDAWVRRQVNKTLVVEAKTIIDVKPVAAGAVDLRNSHPHKDSAWSLLGWRHMVNTYHREPTEQEWPLYQKGRF